MKNKFKTIVETFVDRPTVEETDNGHYEFVAKIGEVERVNRNNRKYPRHIAEQAIAAAKDKLSRRPGANQHLPILSDTFSTSSIRWLDIWVDENNDIKGRGRIIETEQGKDLKANIKAEVDVAFSTRGVGLAEEIFDPQTGRYIDVMSEWYLWTVDATLDPSVETTGIESVVGESKTVNEDQLNEIVESRVTKQTADLTTQIATLKQANESAVVRAQELEAANAALLSQIAEANTQLADYKEKESRSAVRERLLELTNEDRFGAAIQSKITEMVDAGIVTLTLESAERLVALVRPMIEAVASTANVGDGLPRGEVGQGEKVDEEAAERAAVVEPSEEEQAKQRQLKSMGLVL